jgi:hypothetical protein
MRYRFSIPAHSSFPRHVHPWPESFISFHLGDLNADECVLNRSKAFSSLQAEFWLTVNELNLTYTYMYTIYIYMYIYNIYIVISMQKLSCHFTLIISWSHCSVTSHSSLLFFLFSSLLFSSLLFSSLLFSSLLFSSLLSSPLLSSPLLSSLLFSSLWLILYPKVLTNLLRIYKM